MPEVRIPENEFIKATRDEVRRKYCNLWPWEIEKISKEYNQEVINSGAECVVIPGKDIGDNETVVAFTYFDLHPLRAKEIFYTHRIFSTLFPKNFPHFYAAFGKGPDPDHASGTIRQKIAGHRGAVPVYPFESVVSTCQKMELPLGYQGGSQNFATGEDGGEYYLDTLATNSMYTADAGKVISFMKANGYSDTDINIVDNSFSRLKEIYKEAEELSKTQPKKYINKLT